MKLLKNFALAAALAAICVLCSSCASKPKLIDTAANNEKLSYSESYTELSEKRTNKTKAWRRGMVGGNGLEGFITSGSPYSDTIIYQNMHFIMPNINARTCPDTSSELEQVKQSIVKCEDIVDNASYDDVYRFHPGGQLRINSERHRIKDYIRYTDYETAQVGVKYTDKNGTWERTTFTSLADGVTVTKIKKSSKNAPVNITLSYDDISTMANYSEGDEVNIKYKKLADEGKAYLALVAHYPDYEKSELKNGGYATLTYVLNIGGTLSVTQEVHGSSPCVSTRSKSPESVDIQRLRGFFVLQIGAFLYFSYNLKRPDFLTVANKNLTNFLGQIELTASLSCAISMCV